MDNNPKKRCKRDGCPRAKLLSTDWLEDLPGNGGCNIVQVIFKNTRTGYYINTPSLPLKIGDMVVVESQPGYDIGRVKMTGRLVRLQMRKEGVKDESSLRKVLRIPTAAELHQADEAHAREHETMIRTRKIAEDMSLNMKIGDVEYQADAAKAIFYYIADERVDFRALIRVLADTFKIRVEMKQIGARQEAGRIGGIGPCGRPLCCSSWLTKFVSVGTGAARIQDLSMNPQKLAGQCAKLKCCLNFESAIYAEAQKQMPSKDIQLETKDNTYYLFKPDILARKITYSTDRKIPANLVTIDASRAFEIIALNKQGVKPDSLLPDNEMAEQADKKPVDLVEQESLTRFDKSKNKKRRNKTRNESRDNKEKRQSSNAGQNAKAPQQPKKEGKQKPEKNRKAAPQDEERNSRENQNNQGNQGNRPRRQRSENRKKNQQ